MAGDEVSGNNVVEGDANNRSDVYTSCTNNNVSENTHGHIHWCLLDTLVSVVACHRYYHQRCALEAWHIRTEAQTMNHDAGPIPSMYDPLIHQSRP